MLREGAQSMPEGSMNSRLRDLIQQLGEAIHESVIESEQIAGVVQNIRRHGFDVMLMLEATIGLNDVVTAEASAETDDEPATTEGGPFTSNDLNFLKSLRISVTGDEGEDHDEDANEIQDEGEK
jgi:hypothetical protein